MAEVLDSVKDRVGPWIGGSEAYDACADSYALWAKKVGLTEPDDGNVHTERGNALEPFVARLFEHRFGVETFTPKRQEHVAFPWMKAHVDRRIRGERSTIVEIKTVSDRMARQWGADGSSHLPDRYYAQATHNLIVTGAQTCAVPALIGYESMLAAALCLLGEITFEMAAEAVDFRVLRIEHDDALAARVVAAERAFVRRIEEMDPPRPATVAEAKVRWPVHERGKVAIADAEARDLIRQRAALKDAIKLANEEVEPIERRLWELIGDAEILALPDGSPLFSAKCTTSTVKEHVRSGRALRPLKALKEFLEEEEEEEEDPTTKTLAF